MSANRAGDLSPRANTASTQARFAETGFWNPAVGVLLCALLLSSFAALNRQPFFYEDTTTYIRGANEIVRRLIGETHGRDWARTEPAAQAPGSAPSNPSLTSLESRIVLSGRSVYYGGLLLLSYVSTNFWLAVLFQALCVAFTLRLLLVGCLGLNPSLSYAAALGLAALTPLGYFTGLLMPDIFAGLSILIMAMLFVFWEQIGTAAKFALAAILTFGLVSHTSHIALAAVFVPIAATIILVRSGRKHLRKSPFALVTVCIAVAILCEAAFAVAVSRVLGQPPVRLPFFTAHLIELGPGLDYLQKNCATVQFAVCAFLERLPVTWIEFLFSTDPNRGVFAIADPQMKRALSEEQVRFFLHVVRAAPLEVIIGLAKDVLAQIVRFGMMDVAYGPDRWNYFETRLPPGTWASMQRSLAFNNEPIELVLTASAYGSTIVGAAVTAAYALLNSHERWSGSSEGVAGTIPTFLGLVAAGILVNAVVCAALASPLDRFQARVIWLVPLLGLIAAALWYRAHARSLESRNSMAA